MVFPSRPRTERIYSPLPEIKTPPTSPINVKNPLRETLFSPIQPLAAEVKLEKFTTKQIDIPKKDNLLKFSEAFPEKYKLFFPNEKKLFEVIEEEKGEISPIPNVQIDLTTPRKHV